MKKLAIASAILALIVATISYTSLFKRFSPQATINPQTLAEAYDPSAQIAVFNNEKIAIPPYNPINPTPSNVLGENNSNKRIEVDLTNQRVYAYEGDRLIYNFLVSTGKWGRTPTGNFRIWVKLRYSKMEGGSKALNTYYYLPNVPFVMYFSSASVPQWRGYSLHGTYWHSNFGHPMSHGCVNMKTEEAEQIYYWAQPDLQGQSSIYASANNPGTPITIYGTAPYN